MPKRKAKPKEANSLSVLLDFVDVVDTTFERFTGKTVAGWLKEFQQRPRELPQGESAAPPQSDMPLADAYSVLGLPATASPEEVKRNYRNLAVIFHPDRGGYDEAMKLLNRAYQRIKKEKGEKKEE
ncbi:Co-chaperone protein DjlA [subsurface metagenome]